MIGIRRKRTRYEGRRRADVAPALPPASEAAASASYADLPLVDPAGESGLIAVFRKRYLLRLLVARELSARYSGSFLGLLWSYVNPLTQLFIYWFFMGKIMGAGDRMENFAIYIFVGLVAVHFVNETFNAGTRSIMRNKAFVKKMALPLEMFPVSSVIVSVGNALPAMAILVIVCLLAGWRPDLMGMAAFALGIAILVTLSTGFGLMFSVLNVLFRDIGQLVGIMTNFIRFSVPMMYPFSMVTERFPQYVDWYLLNPLVEPLLLFHRAFWVGTTDDPAATVVSELPPDLMRLGFGALLVSVGFMLIGQLVFSRLQKKIPERV